MSVIIQKHFSDLEDITKEELSQFLLISNEEKYKLDQEYSNLTQSNQKVSFATVSEFYSENYNIFIEILEKAEGVRENVERYSSGITDSEHKSPILVDLILLLDIYQTVKNSKFLLKGIIEKKISELSNIKIAHNLQANLEHFISSVKEECFEENDDRNEGKNNCFNSKAKESFDNFQRKFSTLNRELENLKKDFFENSVSVPAYVQDNFEYTKEKNFIQEEKPEILTNSIWPKSRMLLAIVSKMFKEGLLNKNQRGVLKDLIIDNDQRILNLLKQYEADGDRNVLYKNFLSLASNVAFNAT